MLYLIWEYRPTTQYNPMERMEASMLAIKVIDDKQCSSLYTTVMLKSPPMLRYTGPCASPFFHDTQMFLIEQILSNKTREVDLATENILELKLQSTILSYTFRPSFVEARISRSYGECQKCEATVPSREDHK